MLTFVFTFLLVVFAIQVNTGTINETETWNGNWFPRNPLKEKSKKTDLQELFETTTTETNTKESWKGNWFPHIPNTAMIPINIQNYIYVQPECDDGKTNIEIDFDPENKTHNYQYLCLDRKEKYDPKYATSPIQREFIVPPAFKAPSYCQNETIEYEEQIPTFGAHRHLYPKYGEYIFLPIQRWMHNLEYGVVVMLYHPCANQMQVEKLRGILNACLYRHIITPSISLFAERPLALLVWGKSIEMSVLDVSTVVDFIKTNAKKGPETGEPAIEKYDAGLIAEAKLVTDEADSQICANVIL